MSKILTVFGATGQQGGSVVTSVLKHPKLSTMYKIRAVTRDPSKPSGEALAKRGVEVVKADLGDKDSVKKAVEGSYAVFGVTNFWEIFSKDVEKAQGINIADACKTSGVSMLIWSSVPHTKKMTNGKLAHLDHFDSKAEVEEYIRAEGIPATFIHPGVFMTNIKSQLQKSDDGFALAWNMPATTRIPMIDPAADTGRYVAGALLNETDALGKVITASGGWYTVSELLSTIEKVSGKKVSFNEVTDEQFKSFLPAAVATELTETFILMRDWAYYGPGAESAVSEGLKWAVEKPTTWQTFVEENSPW